VIKLINYKPNGIECEICDSKDNLISFIVDGTYEENYDKSTDCTDYDYNITTTYLKVEDKWVEIPYEILDDNVIEELELQFVEKRKGETNGTSM